MVPGYRVSNDSNEMDIQTIHAYIAETYWAKNIPIETFEKAFNNSLCFGVFTSDDKQVGFARMITDHATFAYLADVYIEEAHQGKGLSKWLMKIIHDHPSLIGLRRIMLATKDAHGLYMKFGYTKLNDPSLIMENWSPDIYSN